MDIHSPQTNIHGIDCPVMSRLKPTSVRFAWLLISKRSWSSFVNRRYPSSSSSFLEEIFGNHDTKSTQSDLIVSNIWWLFWNQAKKSYIVSSCLLLTQSHKLHSLRLTTGLLDPSKISPIWRVEPHIFCMQWLRNMVSSKRMKPSDFMSILVRWTHLKIYCTLMPTCRA